MNCKKCGKKILNANDWYLCVHCFVKYERAIPTHVPKEQHLKYLFKVVRKDYD
jgi:hypothetical protein